MPHNNCDLAGISMAVSKNQIGFECEFVEDPSKCLQTNCPVCLQILREPYQVTCCGKSFCRQCIERVKDEHKYCPCCKEDNFDDFPNKGLQRPLYGFKVLCTNKEKGCEWTGELGKLDNHLNLNPSNDNQLEGCDFAEIECNYCSNFLTRSKLLHHKNEVCDKRPFSCEHCKDYKSTYEDIIHNHLPVCGHHPVQCPNECGAFPRRQNLESHVAKDCPLTVVECEFHYAGCEVKLLRKDMSDHLKDGLVSHFSLLAVSHKRQQDQIKSLSIKHQQEIKALEATEKRQREEIKALAEEVNELKKQTKQLRLHTRIVPVDFVVENPHQYRINLIWSSTPFYSHSEGYKLHIRFKRKINMFTNSFFISAYLMHGEFDDFLKWPLNAVIVIRVLSQKNKGLERRIKLYSKSCVGKGDIETYAVADIGNNLTPYLCSNCVHIRIDSVQFI